MSYDSYASGETLIRASGNSFARGRAARATVLCSLSAVLLCDSPGLSENVQPVLVTICQAIQCVLNSNGGMPIHRANQSR